LPTYYSGDDDLNLGHDLWLIKEDSQLNKPFRSTSTPILGSLPNFDSCLDFDSENEFSTELARFSPPENTIDLSNKRQRLDLTSCDEEGSLVQDNFKDFDMIAQSTSAGQDAKVQEISSTLGSSAALSDGNVITLSTDTATTSVQPVPRRGRKQQLTKNASKSFVCTLCTCCFCRQEHLSRHYRSRHSHDKPLECDKCSKKFSRSDNLSQHARTHRNGAIEIDVLNYTGLPLSETGSLNHAAADARPKKAAKPYNARSSGKELIPNEFSISFPSQLLTQAIDLPVSPSNPLSLLQSPESSATLPSPKADSSPVTKKHGCQEESSRPLQGISAINKGLSRSSKEPSNRLNYIRTN